MTFFSHASSGQIARANQIAQREKLRPIKLLKIRKISKKSIKIFFTEIRHFYNIKKYGKTINNYYKNYQNDFEKITKKNREKIWIGGLPSY